MFSDAVGTPAECGLSESTDAFVLTNQTAFCQESCQSWANELIELPVGCPHNCDLFSGEQHVTCEMFMNTLNSFDSWSKQCSPSAIANSTRKKHAAAAAKRSRR